MISSFVEAFELDARDDAKRTSRLVFRSFFGDSNDSGGPKSLGDFSAMFQLHLEEFLTCSSAKPCLIVRVVFIRF